MLRHSTGYKLANDGHDIPGNSRLTPSGVFGPLNR
jgi:hypothetical protein